MAGQADQVARGNLAVRVELGNVPESCEIHALGYAFNRMAEQLELQHKNRGLILADLSHDLITPLTNLKGYFEGINEGVVVPNPSMYAMLEGEVSRIIRLVNDLHLLTLAEGARAELKPQEIRVEGLFQSGVEFIAAELAQKSIKVEVGIEAGAETILADQDKIARVLRNILQNAAFFAESVSVLKLAAHRELEFIRLTIANTGEPLAERHIPHIFDRFYRADPARSRSGGAGLGLAIAKELVEAHSGTLTVAARGRETEFSICLPNLASP
jgi:signal transduction histidine kinase